MTGTIIKGDSKKLLLHHATLRVFVYNQMEWSDRYGRANLIDAGEDG